MRHKAGGPSQPAQLDLVEPAAKEKN